jgi:hypothetical protein
MDLVGAILVAGVLGLAVLAFALIARATGRRLDLLGAQWLDYARPRGFAFTPHTGGYRFAPGLGTAPTLRAVVDGVVVEFRTHEGRGGKRTEVSTASPSWLPPQSSAGVQPRRGLASWLSSSSEMPTGDPAFDQVLVAGTSPPEIMPRLLHGALRRCLLQLAAFSSFQSFACYNWSYSRINTNRTATVWFEGHVVSPELLDAACQTLVTLHRTPTN